MNIAGVLRCLALSTWIALAAASCRSTAENSADDRLAIERMSTTWLEAAKAGDHARLSSVYAADGALLPPNGEMIRGTAAISQYFEGFPAIKECRLERLEIVTRGDLGYCWGKYSMTLSIPGLGPIDDRGKYIEIWRRQSDGSWKISRDIYNSDLAAPAAGGADTGH